MDYYTLKLRFGLSDKELVGRFVKRFTLAPNAGVAPILDYFEGQSFVKKPLSWASLLEDGWRFIVEPHPAGISWIFLSPHMTQRKLHKEEIPLVGKYLSLKDTYGMLPEWEAWKEAELVWQEEETTKSNA